MFVWSVKISFAFFFKKVKKELYPKIFSIFDTKIYWSNTLCFDGVIQKSHLAKSLLFENCNKSVLDDCFLINYKSSSIKVNEVSELLVTSDTEYKRVFQGLVLQINLVGFRLKDNDRVIVSDIAGLPPAKINHLFFVAIATVLFSVFTTLFFLVFWIMQIDILFLFVLSGFFSLGVIALLRYIYFTWLVRFYNYYKQQDFLKQINLEDVKFANRFKVYSTDEICARLVATPAFMEKLLNLKTAFGVKNLKCSFFDNNLIIAISNKKNLFEIGKISESLENPKFVLQLYRELQSVYDIVDYFKLGK